MTLAGPTLDAVVFDVTGDGRREFARLNIPDESTGALAIEVWRWMDGSWRPLALPETVHRKVHVSFPARSLEGDEATALVPALRDGPAWLLIRRDGDRAELMVATSGDAHSDLACCLTMWRVTPGGTLEALTPSSPAGVDTLLMLDLTGDGRDERLRTHIRDVVTRSGVGVEVAAYRFDENRLDLIDQRVLPLGAGNVPVSVGNSDGRPGDEAAFIEALGAPILRRVSLGLDRQLAMESLLLEHRGSVAPVSLDGDAGLVITGRDQTLLGRWRADSAFEVLAARPDGGRLLPIGREGPEVRIPIVVGAPPRVHVLGADLKRHSRIRPSVASAALADTDIVGYTGPLSSTAPDGRAAAVFGGQLLTTPPQPIGSLAGVRPVGQLASGEWIALLQSTSRDFQLDPRGGTVTPQSGDAMTAIIMRTELALRPEAAGGALRPPLEGAMELGAYGDTWRVLATGDGFRALVAAPRGSQVLILRADPAPDDDDITSATVGPGDRLWVPIRPPASSSHGERFSARIVVVTPAGQVYAARWLVEIRSDPPPLSAATEPYPLSLSVPLSGRTAPDAVVLVDGRRVTVDADGDFRTAVHAPPWHRTVLVEARDPLGNHTVTSLSAAGIVGHRQLPWRAIVALFTAGTGLFLYARGPAVRHHPPRVGERPVSIEDQDSGPAEHG